MRAYVHNFSIWCKLFSSSKQKNHSLCKTPETWQLALHNFQCSFCFCWFSCILLDSTQKAFYLIDISCFVCIWMFVDENNKKVNSIDILHTNSWKCVSSECYAILFVGWIVFRALLYRKKNEETYHLDLSVRLDDIFILSFLNLLSHSHFCTVCFAICLIQFFFFLFFSFNESVLTWSFYRFYPFCKKTYFHTTFFFVIFQHYST